MWVPISPNLWQIKSTTQNFDKKMKKIEKGNLTVIESSQPLNNPLVATKIAYEARFLRYFNFLKKFCWEEGNQGIAKC